MGVALLFFPVFVCPDMAASCDSELMVESRKKNNQTINSLIVKNKILI